MEMVDVSEFTEEVLLYSLKHSWKVLSTGQHVKSYSNMFSSSSNKKFSDLPLNIIVE